MSRSKEPEPYSVYVATNAVTGRRYIGIAKKRRLKARQAEHLRLRPLVVDILKYGRKSFSFDTVAEAPSKSKAVKLEGKIIADNPDCYNRIGGGRRRLQPNEGPTPLEALRACWSIASEEEKAAFKAEIV